MQLSNLNVQHTYVRALFLLFVNCRGGGGGGAATLSISAHRADVRGKNEALLHSCESRDVFLHVGKVSSAPL